MPDEFQAEMDLETLARAREIERDRPRVARAKAAAERKAESLRQQASELAPAASRPMNGSPRETSFKKRGT